MIRQPAGASGHPACADCPVGHPLSTTVVPAGTGCEPGVNGSSSVQLTSNVCGTQKYQASDEVTAILSPGRSLAASIIVIDGCAFGFPARETWLVIWASATRLTAATATPNAAATAVNRTPARHRRSRAARPIHAASMTSVTAVASGTLACVQFRVSTAGSAKLNADPNPAVGTDIPM